MLERLLKLANKLDAAGLNKEADLLDKIAQMDEWDDTAGDWEAFDSMEDVPSESLGDEELGGEFDAELADEDDAALAEGEEGGTVEQLVSQLEAMKGMAEEGLVDEAQLAEVQSQVDALMNLFMGGGPSMITDEEPQPSAGFGGEMNLGGPGLVPGEIPVAEASATSRWRLRRKRLPKLK